MVKLVGWLICCLKVTHGEANICYKKKKVILKRNAINCEIQTRHLLKQIKGKKSKRKNVKAFLAKETSK